MVEGDHELARSILGRSGGEYDVKVFESGPDAFFIVFEHLSLELGGDVVGHEMGRFVEVDEVGFQGPDVVAVLVSHAVDDVGGGGKGVGWQRGSGDGHGGGAVGLVGRRLCFSRLLVVGEKGGSAHWACASGLGAVG